MPGCILVMCGLPASGKTTLVSNFHTSLTGELSCHVIDYDKLMPCDVEGDLINEGQQQDVSLWKKYREEIVTCVDRFIQGLTSSCSTMEQNDRTSAEQFDWKMPLNSPRQVSDELWQHFTDNLGVGARSSGCGDFVIVIDDNMYYRSMRYDFYQLARKYSLGFCEVYVNCPSAVAVTRNQQRTLGKVDDRVLVNMETKMEVPDAGSHHWEKHSLSVSPRSPDDVDCCRELQYLVQRSLADPVMVAVEDIQAKVESRHVCSHNVVHQADQILRKLLANSMKHAKERGATKTGLKSLSMKMADVKLAILDDMRSGVVTFDMEAHDAAKDEHSECFVFVKELFDTRTASIT